MPTALRLFRSSRPDYIETGVLSGWGVPPWGLFRSSRPDYIETRIRANAGDAPQAALFRSSRPDYIETDHSHAGTKKSPQIVPVFQAGLY